MKTIVYCKEHRSSFFPALLSVGCDKCEALNKNLEKIGRAIL